MPRIAVLGAGICGLAAALMLARDGHDVTVLERDDAPAPGCCDDAWDAWERAGVVQFRQAHYLQPRGRAILDEELPDVRETLAAAGAAAFDPLALMPPWIADRRRRPGDERFATLTARRPTLEHAFARAADAEPHVDVRRGVGVERLEAVTRDGLPHVTGVRTATGETVAADLVVDAMGRKSRLPDWLRAIGVAAPAEECEDSGFVYYTRFFRADGDGVPQMRGAPGLAVGSFSILTLPGDNDTWSVTLWLSAGDRPLKRMRDPGRFDAVVGACPLQAHWLRGEPITGVLPMAGVVDRHRRLARDGRPTVTGVALLADAAACTNPSLGRGITLGLMHGRLLRDTVREHAEHPLELAEAWDAATEAALTPWYRSTVREDRARLAEVEAIRRGAEPPPARGPLAAMAAAALYDADLFRVFVDSRACVRSLEDAVAERPDLAERALALAAERGPTPAPGPDRAHLLELLA